MDNNIKYYVAWDDNSNSVYVPKDNRAKPSFDHYGALAFDSADEAKDYAIENVYWKWWIEDSEGEIYTS